MKFDDNIIHNWHKQFNFNKDELDLINISPKLTLSSLFDSELNRRFLDTLVAYKIDGSYKVSVDSCATNIIDYLFQKYVTDETLVITTECEHPSVLNNLRNCKHRFYISSDSYIYDYKVNDLVDQLSNYRNVFVYINTTPIISKVVVPDYLIKRIKNLLLLSEVDHHIVLDEVQGMHFYLRDYSIADSIISTAHALIDKQFNLGILISKSNFRYFDSDAISHYLDLVKLINKYKSFIYQYSMVMSEYYSELESRGIELFNKIPYKFFVINSDATKSSSRLVPFDSNKYIDKRGLELFNKAKELDPNMVYSNNAVVRGIHLIKDFDTAMDIIHDINNRINESI